jgi:hypothetical protein
MKFEDTALKIIMLVLLLLVTVLAIVWLGITVKVFFLL